MNHDVLFSFSVFQFTFLLLDVFILTKTGRNIARKGEYTWFYILIGTHITYLVCNSLWTLAEYDLLRIPRSAMMAISTVSLWSVTNCATSFFLFVVERLKLTWLQSGPGKWLRQIPAMITTLLIVSTPWTGLIFILNEQGHVVHGPLYLPAMALASLYLLSIAVMALVNMTRKKTTFSRKADATLFGSVLIILFYILVDGSLSKASILPVAIFAVIDGIFITMQEASINSDALTGMNNRRKAEEFLTDKLKNASEKEPILLYMGDVNNFKKINDTYGHAVGDEALTLSSQAIKRAIAKYGGFASRYGGDEFLLSWQPQKGTEPDPETMIRDVNESLKELSQDKPYQLVMTMGYALCTDPKEPLLTYIREADSMLYQRKAASGVGR